MENLIKEINMKKIIKFLIIIAIIIWISVIIINKNDDIVVCIDAGHGGTDSGAINNNRYEKDDTLKIAKLIEEYLNNEGIKTVMTRTNDTYVSLRERCKIANKKRADLFISIHRNSAEQGNGVEIWTNSKKKQEDIELSNAILENLQSIGIQTNRGIKSGSTAGENTNYYVLNNTNMTSCLIELGFITDNVDNNLFDENIENYAKAIAEGIIEQIIEE